MPKTKTPKDVQYMRVVAFGCVILVAYALIEITKRFGEFL